MLLQLKFKRIHIYLLQPLIKLLRGARDFAIMIT